MRKEYGLLDIQMRRIFLLQFFAAMVSFLNSVVDGIISGRFMGSEALGVIALYAPVMLFVGLNYTFIIGANIIACGYIGRGEAAKVRSVFSTCLVLVTAFSVLIALVMVLFSGPLAEILGADASQKEQLSAYLCGMAPGIPGSMIMGTLMTFLSVNNNMKLSYISVGISFVFNLVFDLLGVTIFSGGMFGIGLATSLAFYASAAVLFAGFRKKKDEAALYFSGKTICFSRTGEMLKLGSTKLFMTVSMVISQYLVNIFIINKLGADGIAVLSVFNIMNSLMSAITSSLASAELTVGSIVYGQRDKKTFQVLGARALRLGLIISIPVGLLLVLFRGPVSSLFFETGTGLWSSTCNMLLNDAILFQLNMVLFVFLFMYRSRQKTALVNAILIENQLGMAAFVVLTLTAPNPKLVWTSFAFNELASIMILCIYGWIRSRKISFRADVLLNMDDFDMTDYSSLLNMSVASEEEAAVISKKLCAVGMEELLPKRIVNHAGLCLEELVLNIISFGLKKGQNQQIRVFVSRHDSNLYIYTWDNGALFDTKAYMDQFVVSEEDTCKNIGLRIVAKLADELVYQSRFGMNFIMMRFSLEKNH